MGTIARFPWIVHRYDQSGAACITSDTTGRLNVFRSRFWLPHDSHQTKTRNIETDLNHVRRQAHVHRPAFIVAGILIEQLLKNVRDLAALNAAREFKVTIDEAPQVRGV